MPTRIARTDDEWRHDLEALAYKVTRKGATERAHSHDDFPDQAGVFRCVCCNADLFATTAKFESGTGWPSFFAPVSDAAVGEKPDNSLFSRRTEVHCTACAAHLGHVFPDGPEPTGLRYCVNGVALVFNPTKT